MSRTIIAGRIGAPHGVKGWMRIESFLEPAETLFAISPWVVKGKHKTETLSDYALEQHGKQFLIRFNHCNTPEQARDYTNALIEVEREQLPVLPKGEYYRADLEGLTVITRAGKRIGQVQEIMATGANDVLVVVDQHNKSHLIPYIDQVVIKVDLVKQELRVDWDENWLY